MPQLLYRHCTVQLWRLAAAFLALLRLHSGLDPKPFRSCLHMSSPDLAAITHFVIWGALDLIQPYRPVNGQWYLICSWSSVCPTFFLASRSEAPAAVGFELPVVEAGNFVSWSLKRSWRAFKRNFS